MPIAMVVFDVGGTLVDESGMWHRHAENLGVPTSDLLSVLEEVVARGDHHRQALAEFDPHYIPAAGRRPGEAYEKACQFDQSEFYPDVHSCFEELRRQHYQIAIAGNQPASVEHCLRAVGLSADFVITSEALGIAKPHPAFFQHIVETSGLAASQLAYVGDRLDNDVLPAKAAGMRGILLGRGLWGRIHAKRPAVSEAHAVIDNLSVLLPALKVAP